MTTIRNARRGFTLVEILIVVIILGILAAIVIPQFSNASNDARKSSLVSQLQTLRSQIQLYSLQHGDSLPSDLVTPSATPWDQMTVKSNADQSLSGGTLILGPYLQAVPVNSLNALSSVVLATSDYGSGAGGPAAPSAAGWVFDASTGKIWATSKSGSKIYDETNPSAATNDQ